MSHLDWSSQRGSTTLTLVWFMIFALGVAIGLDSLFGVYFAQRRGHTAATAAALALNREITVYLPIIIREETASRVTTVTGDLVAKQAIQDFIDQLNQGQQLCALIPECTPLTAQQIAEKIHDKTVSEYIAAFSRHYRGSISQTTAEQIVAGTWSGEPAVSLMNKFVPDNRDLGDLVLETSSRYRDQIFTQADAFAQANGARLDWSQTLVSQPGGDNRVVVLRTVNPFGADWIFEDGNLPSLPIAAHIKLTHVGNRTPQYQ